MTKWLVYILRCADDTLYTGITNDLIARLRAHHAGRGAKYVRGRLPARVVYTEYAADRASASQRERAIKRLDTAAKRRLIADLANRSAQVAAIESPRAMEGSP